MISSVIHGVHIREGLVGLDIVRCSYSPIVIGLSVRIYFFLLCGVGVINPEFCDAAAYGSGSPPVYFPLFKVFSGWVTGRYFITLHFTLYILYEVF